MPEQSINQKQDAARPMPPQDPADHQKKLPRGLAGGLSRAQRRALDHPVRREILRALDRESPATLVRLVELVPGRSVSTISYHALVLEECGCISVQLAVAGPSCRHLESSVAGDAGIRSALDATRSLDGLDG